jgi:hypothetical protein
MSSPTLSVDAHGCQTVQRVYAGDKEAFYQLVQPYVRAIFTTATSVLRNEAAADECRKKRC